MEEKLFKLEHSKNDSNRYYQVLRVLNREKSKIPLWVHDKDGIIASTEKQQAEIVTKHFQKMLAPENAPPNNKIYPPHQMTIAFTGNEIFKAVQSMKNGKSTGMMKSMQNTSNVLQLPYTTALQKYSTPQQKKETHMTFLMRYISK